MQSFISKPALQESIDAARMRKKRLIVKLKAKRDSLLFVDLSKSLDQLSEYEKMNDELRRVKIYEAELVYLRNQL